MTDFVEMFGIGSRPIPGPDLWALHIDRKTVRKYLAPALAEGLAQPGRCLRRGVVADTDRAVVPELIDPAVRALTWGQIAEHRQWIGEQFKVPVTVATIASGCVTTTAWTCRSHSTSLRRATFSEQRLEERVTVSRGSVEPGSEAQIDYGRLGMWLDPDSGRRVAVWVFAMILSCSRALFVQPVLKMNQTSWNASHVAASSSSAGCRRGWCATTSRPG